MKLNVRMIGREALMLLRNEIAKPTPQVGRAPASLEMVEPREGIFYQNVALEEDSLDLSLEVFSSKFVHPAMRLLAIRVRDIPLGDEFMEIPKNWEAGNESFAGIAMRTIIADKWPWNGEPGVWRRVVEYYDISTDNMKSGPCGIGLTFTVHKPGAEVYIPVVSFQADGPLPEQ